MFDNQKIRANFPIFDEYPELIYLDNAATTHKPGGVIQSQIDFYTKSNSNVHRGNYDLAIQATDLYENSRKYIQKFVNAANLEEIIFTKGTTESINLVASVLGSTINNRGVGEYFSNEDSFLQPGDEILVSQMEHHANLVPWQILAAQKGLKLKFIPVLENGELDLVEFEKALTPKVKFVAITHVSNLLGTINPIQKITKLAHQNNTLVLVDGAQAINHLPVDVQELDVDFYAFSAHKVFGPTGSGVLYARKEILQKLPPYQSGGDMIDTVDFEKTVFNELPFKFEAGTPNIAGVVGMAEGLRYLEQIQGLYDVADYEQQLLQRLVQGLQQIEGVQFIGTAENKVAIQSFSIPGVHPQDLAIYLAGKNICIRSGFHCVQPLLNKLGYENGACRVSLSLYNTFEEVDKFLFHLKKGLEILR